MCIAKVAAICDSFNFQFMLQREVNFYLSVTAKCPALKKFVFRQIKFNSNKDNESFQPLEVRA